MNDQTELRIRESIARHIMTVCRLEQVDLSAVLAVVFAEVTSGACAHYGGKQTAAFLRQTAKAIEGASPLADLALYVAAPMGRA